MDKRAFIKHVRAWEADVVLMALAADRALASYRDKIGKTPLHHCAEINPLESKLNAADSIRTARALIDAGADVNSIRVIIDDGEEFLATALWYAVAWGKNFDLVRYLLERGARPDENAVGSAIWDQDLRVAELLRKHGGNIDHASRGETPLIRTVRARRLVLLKWLIEHGANINFQDAHGYTALHHAVNGKHTLDEIEVLLRFGARSDLKAKDGSTPVSIARKKGKRRLLQLLTTWTKGP